MGSFSIAPVEMTARTLGNLSSGLAMDLDDLYGPFQAKPFCDAMILWLLKKTCFGPLGDPQKKTKPVS